jgi:hypothetical protein
MTSSLSLETSAHLGRRVRMPFCLEGLPFFAARTDANKQAISARTRYEGGLFIEGTARTLRRRSLKTGDHEQR